MLAEIVERASSPVPGDSGLSCDDLANRIRVSVDKGDQYHKTAGILLLEAKRRLPEFGLTWSAFLVGKCHLKTSRSYELIAIAEGRTTVAEVQAKGRERAARHAAKNKEARSSVSNGQPASPDPLSEQRNIVTLAMRDLALPEMTLLAQYAASLIAMVELDEEEPTAKLTAIKWQVKHVPAKTVYTIKCQANTTLTVGFGDPIHPDDADFVARADERKDVPEHWALCGRTERQGWTQSIHETKEGAREALRANRLTPPNPPSPFLIADGETLH